MKNLNPKVMENNANVLDILQGEKDSDSTGKASVVKSAESLGEKQGINRIEEGRGDKGSRKHIGKEATRGIHENEEENLLEPVADDLQLRSGQAGKKKGKLLSNEEDPSLSGTTTVNGTRIVKSLAIFKDSPNLSRIDADGLGKILKMEI